MISILRRYDVLTQQQIGTEIGPSLVMTTREMKRITNWEGERNDHVES